MVGYSRAYAEAFVAEPLTCTRKITMEFLGCGFVCLVRLLSGRE